MIAYIYVSYYYRYPRDTKVLNADINKFDTNLLYDKHPIVLLNNTKTLMDLKKEVFNNSFVTILNISQENWNKNNFKYLLIQPLTEIEIYLLPAYKNINPDETIITLQMTPTQILILPLHWKYSLSSKANIIGIHDYISWMLP